MLLCAWALACGAHAAQRAQQTAAELESILAELNELDNWFTDAADRRAGLQKELRTRDTQINAINAKVRTANQELAATVAEGEQLREHRDRLLVDRQVQAERIGQHLASAYRLSGEDLIKQLLNQESPAQLERMVRYHGYFSRARIDALKRFEQIVADIETNRESLSAQQALLQTQTAQLETRRQTLLGERKERGALIDELKAQVESKQVRQARLRKDQERLEALLTRLREADGELDGRAFAARRGSLPVPIAGTLAGRFGQVRADGRMRWQGLSYNAPTGTGIHAVFSGRVVFADWLRGYGLLVILDHGGDYMTLYGNADSLLKSVGDRVEGGEQIAQAGRSGGQADSGLYFEVRHKGAVVNPLAWLVKP